MSDFELNIGHFYPDLLNLYGDRGNVLSLYRRASLRGIKVNIKSISIDSELKPDELDLCFIGGGQDNEQNILKDDFVNNKGPLVKKMIEDGKVFLCICGGYQMLGKYYLEHDGSRLDCLGALDLYTEGADVRFINDTVYEYEGKTIIGFENHSGRTYLNPEGNCKPFMKVVKGHGNNGEDGMEGAVYKNTFCTYSHGSFLPKNPFITDMLIEKAMQNKYGSDFTLALLDSSVEELANREALKYLNV
ncbi:MAG: glutamine amidotransferase [Clostridia bacterium]|nr:glutamine amidotransferase [Clostridia bacterium]